MEERPLWRPASVNPAMAELLRRPQVDFDTDRLVLKRILEQKNTRTPEQLGNNTSASDQDAESFPDTRPGPSWQPINTIRVQDGENSGEEELGRREDADDDALADRDWEILSLDGRKVERDVVLYRVCWAYTIHPTAVVYERTTGDLFADVDGNAWPVSYRSESQQPETGEKQSVVEWRETWLPLWRLYKAYDLVLDYERKYSRDPGTRYEPTIVDRPLHLDGKIDPEVESGADQGVFEPDYLPIENEVDYTMSFLAHQLEDLRRGRSAIAPSSIARFLNHPLRQLLIFTDDFVQAGYRMGRQNERALFVYVVGEAWEMPCDGCRDGTGPFRKCVTFGKDLHGACTNCVYRNQSPACGLHHDNRMVYLQRQKNAGNALYSTSLPGTPFMGSSRSSSPEKHDPASRSSVEAPDIEGVLNTPPSSVSGAEDNPDDSSEDPPHTAVRCYTGLGKRRQSQAHPDIFDRAVKRDPCDMFGTLSSDRHGACRGNRRRTFRCIDPNVGSPADFFEPGANYPPNVVFSDRHFEPGEATPEEVQFVVSQMPCRRAEFLHEGWLKYLEQPGRAEGVYESKWVFLTCVYYEHLNELISMFCPSRKQEIVCITIED